MAQPPSSNLKETPAATRSHGRGGAGNINAKSGPAVNAEDLQTPTIKSNTYTTGRGGSGNMAVNNPSNPSDARAAQDVDAPAHHAKDMQGTYHWGRGGEGNMTTLGKSGAQQARDKSHERKSSKDRGLANGEKGAERRPSFKSALSKGKEFLGLNKKGGAVQDPSKDESAIE